MAEFSLAFYREKDPETGLYRESAPKKTASNAQAGRVRRAINVLEEERERRRAVQSPWEGVR